MTRSADESRPSSRRGRIANHAAVVGVLLLGQQRSHPRDEELTAAPGVEE
jgi:hypothetical protein